MKALILAAGEGKRLRPLTNDIPKCMVEYQGMTIIDSILEAMKGCEFRKIAVVCGYKAEVLREYLKDEDIVFYQNAKFNKTNMVSTLFCAEDFMDDDLIISYGDIVYEKGILEKLIKSENDLSVVVDRKWKELWMQRMSNPLDDCETLKIKSNKIIELGKKPKSYGEIEGQYIGLIKISQKVILKVIEFYKELDKEKDYDNQDFDNMYMTSFIQMIINKLMDVNPVFIDGGWNEIDFIDDLTVNPIKDK